MTSNPSPKEKLRAEHAELRARLEEAEETLRAIRSGEVDALVVETAEGPQVFSLDAAQAASNRFRGEILAQVSDAVIAVDREECITFVNASAERQYGARSAEVLGCKLSKMYISHWPGPDAEAATWNALREHGEWHGEIVHRLHDGRERHVELSVTMLPGADAGTVTTIRDITERKATEAKLREHEYFLARLTDVSPSVIQVFDLEEKRSVFINRTVASLIGYSPEEIAAIGENVVPILMHPDDLARFPAHLDRVRALRDDETADFEHRMRNRTGEWHWFHNRDAVFARDATGAVRQLIGTTIEITARKQVEAQMITMNEQLIIASVRQHELTEKAEKLSVQLQADLTARKKMEEALRASEAQERASRNEAEAANRSKDTFLATLSHELRTPLTAILGWSVLLRTTKLAGGQPVHPDVDHGLAVIERNARVQGKLIEDVLDIARITSGKFILDLRPLDLTSLVFAAVDAVRPAVASKGLTLEVADGGGSENGDGDGDGLTSLWVSGDSSRLQQAVSNLLTNAIKFTPSGGRVAVRVERVKRTDADTARITVTDTGKGIDAEFLPSVFERFKQANEGTTRSYGGLGLGLSVVRHIINAHGGTVRAMSEGEGKGATFILELPITPQPAAAVLSGKPTSTLNLTRLDGVRVLVVDDEEDCRLVTKRVLEAAGATVVLAASAEEGYRLAMNGKGRAGEAGGAGELQVIVSDIGMPGEDGYSMIQRVRAEKGGKDLPAVAMTAFAAPEDKRRAIVAGFQTHLAKPVDPHDLIAVVAGLVGKTRA